jgi:hypothetical protein
MRTITLAIGLTFAAIVCGSAAAEPGTKIEATSLKAKMDAAKRDGGNDLRAKVGLRADGGTYKTDAVLNLAELRTATATMDASIKSDVRAVSSAAKAAGAISSDAAKTIKTQGFKRSDIASAATTSQYRPALSDKAIKRDSPSNKLR